MREAVGHLLMDHWVANHERYLTAVRAALGEEAFAAALAEGRAMTWEQAIEYALEEAGRANASASFQTMNDLSGTD